MKKCDQCGNRAQGLGTYATQFQDITLCAECYEKIKVLRTMRNKKIETIEQYTQLHTQAVEMMQKEHYQPKVIQGIERWMDEKKQEILGNERMVEATSIIDHFLMTSGFSFEGYKITAYHGVVCGESVLGTGFLSSWNASISDTFGVESSAFIDKLKEARNHAKRRAVENAIRVGGNALIGIDIDYTVFSSNIIGVIFNATSVTVEKIE